MQEEIVIRGEVFECYYSNGHLVLRAPAANPVTAKVILDKVRAALKDSHGK